MSHSVGYFIGSLATVSINRQLARALIRLAPPELTFTEIRFSDLPLYTPDYDADFPPVAREFKEAIHDVDAVLFVTPEYNRSIPGGLKNAIDWASRPYGQNAFARKPSAVIGASRAPSAPRWPAAPAQPPQLLQLAADERTGGLHPVHAGPDHARGRGHQRIHRGLPAQLHEGTACLHRARHDGVATAEARDLNRTLQPQYFY
jgi:hypothetical protein